VSRGAHRRRRSEVIVDVIAFDSPPRSAAVHAFKFLLSLNTANFAVTGAATVDAFCAALNRVSDDALLTTWVALALSQPRARSCSSYAALWQAIFVANGQHTEASFWQKDQYTNPFVTRSWWWAECSNFGWFHVSPRNATLPYDDGYFNGAKWLEVRRLHTDLPASNLLRYAPPSSAPAFSPTRPHTVRAMAVAM